MKHDIPCEKHVNDCDEKTALLDKIKFLENDCYEKHKLIKLLKEKESNTIQELGKAKESIQKLTIDALDKIIEVGKPYGDKRGLGYIDECSTFSSSKTIFVKPSSLCISLAHANLYLSMINLDLCLYVIIVVLKVILDLIALN